jgi:hypothetical protein
LESISPQVFIVEGQDISSFGSLDDAIEGVEPQDVEDGVFEAFDSTGRVIELTAEAGRVKAVPTTLMDPTRLFSALEAYLAAEGELPSRRDGPALVEAFGIRDGR